MTIEEQKDAESRGYARGIEAAVAECERQAGLHDAVVLELREQRKVRERQLVEIHALGAHLCGVEIAKLSPTPGVLVDPARLAQLEAIELAANSLLAHTNATTADVYKVSGTRVRDLRAAIEAKTGEVGA